MESSQRSILKSTGIMTIATLLSRLTGLGRTWAMAFALGNTIITSAYQVANNMPNVIYDLVAGGIIGTAFLPVYLLQTERLGRSGGDKFASNILNIACVVLGAIALLATVFAPWVITTQTFTVSDQSEVFNYAVAFFRIFAIQIVFYGLGGVITGVLNAHRIYGLPSLAPVFNNIIVIATFFIYVPLSHTSPDFALIFLAVGTSLGVLAQFALQIPALIKMKFQYSFYINLRDPALREALRIAVPTLIYIAGTLISFSCRNAFSLQTSEVAPSTLLYAWTWYQLPYGVVAVSISTAFLTEMSTAVARDNKEELRLLVSKGLRSTMFLIIPLAALLSGLAPFIMQIFRAGSFDQQSVYGVADILSLWALSLPFYAGQMYFYRVFASLRQFMTFALISCGLCVVQIDLYAVLGNPEIFGLAGIPVADFIYFGLQFIIMGLVLRRRIGAFGFKELLKLCVLLCISSAAAVLVAGLIAHFVSVGPGVIANALLVCGAGLAGLLVNFLVCRLMRIPEMQVLDSIKRKVLKRA